MSAQLQNSIEHTGLVHCLVHSIAWLNAENPYSSMHVADAAVIESLFSKVCMSYKSRLVFMQLTRILSWQVQHILRCPATPVDILQRPQPCDSVKLLTCNFICIQQVASSLSKAQGLLMLKKCEHGHEAWTGGISRLFDIFSQDNIQQESRGTPTFTTLQHFQTIEDMNILLLSYIAQLVAESR